MTVTFLLAFYCRDMYCDTIIGEGLFLQVIFRYLKNRRERIPKSKAVIHPTAPPVCLFYGTVHARQIPLGDYLLTRIKMLKDAQFEFSYDAIVEQNNLKVRTLSIQGLMMPTKRFLFAVIGIICLVPAVSAQPIPRELWGRWIVRRDLPTHMISCWGDEEARKLLGTEIEYSAELFRWKEVVTKNPTAVTSIITARQFHGEYSGQGAGSSDVTFKEIGINAGQAKRITIRHSDAQVSGATVEVPGDDVLVKDQSTIIFSMCSVFFEAKRATNSPGNPTH